LTGTVRVYRAISSAELEDLRQFGRFRNPYGNEVKYFALAREGAVQYAAFAVAVFGEGPYWLVAATFPSRFIGWRPQAVVDRGIATFALPTDLLLELQALEFLGAL